MSVSVQVNDKGGWQVHDLPNVPLAQAWLEDYPNPDAHAHIVDGDGKAVVVRGACGTDPECAA